MVLVGANHARRQDSSQMVRVIEAQFASRLLQLLGGETFQRGLRRHGHKYGERNRSMGEVERCSACFGDL